MFENRDIAPLRRGYERFEKALLLGRGRGRRSASCDVLPSAGHDLPCVGLCESKDVRDVVVCVVERLAKDIGGSFGGRAPTALR
jgi:hypothetical protein